MKARLPEFLWAWVCLESLLGVPTLVAGGALQGRVRCPEPAVVYAVPAQPAPVILPREPAVIEQRDLQFRPSVLPVLQGTRVLFPNVDPLYHNVFSVSPPRPFNLGMYGPGEVRGIVFDRPGIVQVRCMVHPEMVAWVVVLTTPYFQMTDPQGTFVFRDLPEGRYQVHAWSPRCGLRVVPGVDVSPNRIVRLELAFPDDRPASKPQGRP